MTVQKHIRLDDDVAKLVNEWRKQQVTIPSFNSAINMLMRLKTHDVVPFISEGIVEIPAFCPKCGNKLLVSLSEINK